MKLINPDAPDEYKYETDYRNIPREYLNPRIPQGRGMVKWQAFKTLPEQYERLEQYIQDQNKIDKPILSDDQLSELNDTLVFKMFHDPVITVNYYEDGYIKNIEGYIRKVDDYEQMLYLDVGTGLSRISLMDIVEIK
ncbi:YolD-like family protein [Staphylococcus nepalensis]|uniref:YolD-like family protein n=1 Tax=Staphylococcus nepalensis TaxID=214473 RepID=UPI0032E86FD2